MTLPLPEPLAPLDVMIVLLLAIQFWPSLIKAYRLKGDTLGLKQAIFSSFDASALVTAHKRLWDACKDLLGHQRRGSEKRQVTEVVLADFQIAFDKLDNEDKLPNTFCEANDLIRLPSLALDPVSKKLDSNSSILDSLVHKVQDLPSTVTAASSDSLAKCCSNLDSLILELKAQLNQFSSTVSLFSHKLPPPSANSTKA